MAIISAAARKSLSDAGKYRDEFLMAALETGQGW